MSALETRVAKGFARRLRLTRETRGLTQLQVAERTGLKPAAVSHFETGQRRPSLMNLRRLCDALRVSSDYLIGRAVQP